ncbi:MAG: T9SS type A sorting domain-containing protein [Saprospiraceae bacterium]
MKNTLLTTLFLFLFILTAKSQITINEVQAVTQGNGSNKEFIEIKGPVGTTLDGYVLVLFDGDNNATYGCYDLDGQTILGVPNTDGYFIIGNVSGAYSPNGQNSIPNQNWLQNGVDGVALYKIDDCPSDGTVCGSGELTAANLVSHVIYYSAAPGLGVLTCLGTDQYIEPGTPGVSLQYDETNSFPSIEWYFAGQTIAQENAFLIAQPVELTSFDSKVLDNNSVILFWSTASEENNSHFVIEHSRDGERFKEIGQKTGMGTTTNAHTYNMRHERLAKGYHYYRLKQVDFDGKYEYSNIITAQLKLTLADVSITPNPTMEKVTIFIDTPISIAASYQLVNMQKEVMIEKTIDKGNSSFEIDMTNLPGGVYFMRFYVDQQVIAKKIVKLY